MKKHSLLTIMVSLLAVSAWAADVALKENFRVAPTGNTAAVSNKDWQGDLCTWHATSVARRAQDTINTATIKQATWLVLNSRVGEKIYTTNWEGGVKKLSFKFARYGKENTNGRVLKIKASVGTTEYESDGYAKSTLPSANVAAIVSPATTTGHVVYSYDFQHKENDQLTIENASTCSDAEAASNGICRILVSDIEITPYLLYRNKDVIVGLKQRGYVNNGTNDFINNTEGEGSISYSSSAENVATVDGNGVITPVGVGETTITATWSEGASTTYTLHVVDGIIAENFSKVAKLSQVSEEATWHGDLFDWKVLNVRRGADDTISLAPRIQATALRSNTNTYLYSNNKIEGGVKHIAFDWRQWGAKGNATKLYVKFYYSEDKENWGNAVASKDVDAATASTPFEFDEDVEGGDKNAYLKMEYSADAAVVAVMGTMKITPYLLYTTKEATLDTRNGLTYTNNGSINNTNNVGTIEYSIEPTNADVEIDGTGQVSVIENADVNEDFTVTAKWGDVETTYTLHIISRSTAHPSFANSAVRMELTDDVPANALDKDGHDATPAYSSSNTAVADFVAGVLTINGVGETTITAEFEQTENYKAAEASYKLYVRDGNARKETFSLVTADGVVGETLTPWAGDLFDWQVQYQVRRKDGDNIEEGTGTAHLGTSVGIQDPEGTPISSFLQSKASVEGGIKYLSFYWSQWGAAYNSTRRIRVYAGETLIGSSEHPDGSQGHSGDEFLLGINSKVKSNQQLIIKNESYEIDSQTGDTILSTANKNSRIVIGVIEITPYLLYTNKAHTMRVGDDPYIHPLGINNIGSEGTISYSIIGEEGIASINGTSGEVTALKAGEVKVQATWSEGAYTYYFLTIKPAEEDITNRETFPTATEYTYKAGVETIQEDYTWTVRQAGVNTNANLSSNAAFIRQRRDDETKQSYIMSAEIPGGIKTLAFDWNLVGIEDAVTKWDIVAKIMQNEEVIKEVHLTNNAGDVLENVHTRNASMRSTVLTDIDIVGKFVIRFENKSTIKGEYASGNKGRFVFDNIEWISKTPELVVDENSNNNELLTQYAGQTKDIGITRSPLVGGVWNTLCLPFAISKHYDLDDADVQVMTSAQMDGEELNIGFTALIGDELEAGKPYLVKPAENLTLSDFANKVILSEPASVQIGNVTMHGIFSPFAMTEGDHSTLFVGTPKEDANLFYPSQDGSLKGFRAYFKLSGTNNAPKRARFVVNQTNVTTDIESVQHSEVSVQKVLRDGQLFILRDGKMYNAQGARVQ